MSHLVRTIMCSIISSNSLHSRHFGLAPFLIVSNLNSLLVLYNSTKKRQHHFDILKAFFVRHSSEYKTLDSDRMVNRNIYPDAVTRDRMRQIDPKSGQLGPIHHCLLEES